MDSVIKFLEARVKEIIAKSENEERKIKEHHLAREREKQLKFERHQLNSAEFSKAQSSTLDLPNKQSVKLPKLVITKYNGVLSERQTGPRWRWINTLRKQHMIQSTILYFHTRPQCITSMGCTGNPLYNYYLSPFF